ncbi:hypothetical protein N7456_007259 [Penicillium angulare]|uniref:Uncharacterized protein n=1 Tax=Penicillium angulare TaxID=116970 RepID=A0A9W9KDN8_9EURO|nr:hypothetical protein N7456_007259 [Penicillium angulare]
MVVPEKNENRIAIIRLLEAIEVDMFYPQLLEPEEKRAFQEEIERRIDQLPAEIQTICAADRLFSTDLMDIFVRYRYLRNKRFRENGFNGPADAAGTPEEAQIKSRLLKPSTSRDRPGLTPVKAGYLTKAGDGSVWRYQNQYIAWNAPVTVIVADAENTRMGVNLDYFLHRPKEANSPGDEHLGCKSLDQMWLNSKCLRLDWFRNEAIQHERMTERGSIWLSHLLPEHIDLVKKEDLILVQNDFQFGSAVQTIMKTYYTWFYGARTASRGPMPVERPRLTMVMIPDGNICEY